MKMNLFDKSETTKQQVKRLFEYKISNNCPVKCFFDVHSMEEVVGFNPDLINEAHVNDFYLIAWFEDGMGRLMIDFKEYDIQDGAVFFVSPGQILQNKKLLRHKGHGIIFTEDFLDNMSVMMRKYVKDEIFGSHKSSSICYLDKNNLIDDVKYRIRTISDEYENGKQLFGYHDKLALLLSDLIIFLKRQGTWSNLFDDGNMGNDYCYYLDFIDYVEDHFRQMRDVKDYAKALNMSVGTLNKSVTKISGKRPLEIINDRIALEAKRMLNYSLELKVKQVSGMLGFDDVSNFVKFFKHIVGMTPSDFRELY